MMKRKKNKGGKFARMNEEERAQYMQHRAEFELEAKRRKQQLIAIFTKNKLKREEAFYKLNIAKINEKWRYVLRQIKCTELYENVKYIRETFDRAVKIKDETILCLHKELKTADADHRKLEESHIILINNVIGKYKERLKILHDTYNLNNIKRKNINALNELTNYLEQNCKEIYSNIVKKTINSNKKQSEVKIRNATNILSMQYLEEDLASNLVQYSFLKIECLWDQLRQIVNEYERTTENKRKQYEYLKDQDSVHQISILQYPKTCLQLQNAIESLKYHIEILSEKRNDRIERLKVKEEDLSNKFKTIKHEITVAQLTDSCQIRNLTVTSNELLKYLQQIMEKGSTIQEIVKICSTLEPISFNTKKYFMQDKARAEFLDANIPMSYNKINKFWEQYNYIKVDNILLKKKGDKLCAENEELKYGLQTYITKISGRPILRSIVTALH